MITHTQINDNDRFQQMVHLKGLSNFYSVLSISLHLNKQNKKITKKSQKKTKTINLIIKLHQIKSTYMV